MKKLSALTIALTFCVSLSALDFDFNGNASKPSIWRKGFVTGSLESNSILYANDLFTRDSKNKVSFGTNNYLKVDFGIGLIEAGLQMEGYFPQLKGYSEQMTGFSLATKYVRVRHNGLTVTAGDFYDQLGSGLLFRSYEERELGINTAIEGGHIAYNWDGKVQVKAFAGFPKLYKTYNYNSWIAAADVRVNVMQIAQSDLFDLSLEASLLNKHQKLDSEWMMGQINPNVTGVSARVGFDWNGLNVKGEYIHRGGDASQMNEFNLQRSNIVLLEAAYTYGGFGANVTFRSMNNASFQSDYNQGTIYTALNYAPSLTQQHTYSLASIYPYQSQMNKEVGGQADFYYFFPRHSVIGGPKGMKLHGNFSTYYGPTEQKYQHIKKNELYFRELTVDAERWWGKNLKTIFMYSWQTLNNRFSTNPAYEFRQSHIIALDATYKINSEHSVRAEYQHLWSAQNDGNWCAATIEYNVSPGWSVNISDMWNYGYTGTHYVNGGVSYSRTRVRAALNFGKFREGYQCAGGVCRLIPAYTGVNLQVTVQL